MYINLDKKYLESNKKKMELEAIEVMSDEGSNKLLIQDLNDEVEYEFSSGDITLSSDSDLGYISVDYKLSDEEMMDIVRHMQRKANKIKELIKLADE